MNILILVFSNFFSFVFSSVLSDNYPLSFVMKFQSILSASGKLWNFEYVRVKAVTVACTITQREKKKKIKQ